MNNKEYQGNIPYFAVILSDILGMTPNKESLNSKGLLQ